jgi:hypothetical protein
VKLCNFWSHHTGIAALFAFNVLPQVVNVKQCIVNEAAVTARDCASLPDPNRAGQTGATIRNWIGSIEKSVKMIITGITARMKDYSMLPRVIISRMGQYQDNGRFSG